MSGGTLGYDMGYMHHAMGMPGAMDASGSGVGLGLQQQGLGHMYSGMPHQPLSGPMGMLGANGSSPSGVVDMGEGMGVPPPVTPEMMVRRRCPLFFSLPACLAITYCL